jgi:hypothetical protein
LLRHVTLLVPGIHIYGGMKTVDGRDQPGHDELTRYARR